MKKELSIDELFCGMPNLRRYFKMTEESLRKRITVSDAEELLQNRREKNEQLLEIAKDLKIADLQAIYYLRKLFKLRRLDMYRILKKAYENTEMLIEWNEYHKR